MKNKSIIWSYVGVVVIAAGVAALVAGLNVYSDKVKPNFVGRTDVYVYPGDKPEDVLSGIDSLVLRPRSISRVVRHQDSLRFQPGHYVLDSTMTTVYALRMFTHGWQTPVKLVLSGSMRHKSVIARKISAQMMVDSASVHKALCDTALLARYGFTPQNVFSMILPDTYQMWWTASVEEILQKQKDAWDAFWTPENLQKAKDRGLSPQEVSVLASIVKGESNYQPEFPSIAGVYLNRLARGMKLQADPTVAFCFDYKLSRIYRKHTEVDSPYNTYVNYGLPPGPICVPTKPCLEAVLNPDKHGYMFFCADPSFNGSHRFAATYAEHLRNASAFQHALNQRNSK